MLGQIVRALKGNATLYKLSRGTLFRLRALLPPLTIDGVPGRVHRNDYMLSARTPEQIEYYRDSGQKDSEWVSQSIDKYLGWDKVQSLMDFGGGYGRLTRWFAQKMPSSAVTLAEMVPEAVRFGEQELKVRGLVTTPQIEGTKFGNYDVVVAHGVLTNLGPERQKLFFRTMERIVNAGGLVCFTVQGTVAAENATRVRDYFKPAEIAPQLAAEGIVFFPYTHYGDPQYGDVFANEPYLRKVIAAEAPSFEVVSFEPASWLHDQWVLKKTA